MSAPAPGASVTVNGAPRACAGQSLAELVVALGLDPGRRGLARNALAVLRADGLDVGLVNKPTLNVVDDEMMARAGSTGFVLVVESLNRKTGLGVRYGTWLLERGHAPRYRHIGTRRVGGGGLWEQMAHQGIDPDSIVREIRELVG